MGKDNNVVITSHCKSLLLNLLIMSHITIRDIKNPTPLRVQDREIPHIQGQDSSFQVALQKAKN